MKSRPRSGPDLRHPSSFRDPDSTVFLDGSSVLRVFRTTDARNEALAALEAQFARDAIAAGRLTTFREADNEEVPTGFTGGVVSERLPFATDPREWSFEMRKDAALLTLELSRAALADGFEMKDASAFNILFDGCRPVFVDHGSFRHAYSGHWPAYGQFGDHFMTPLVIEAAAGITARDAGFAVDGIAVDVATAVTRGMRRFRKGSFAWIRRRALAERVSRKATVDTGERLAGAQLPLAAVDKIQARATALVESLSSAAPSFWRGYESEACPYDDEQSAAKRGLVESWCERIETRDSALDVGCNIGTYSEILARYFDRVIAADSDSVAIDHLYRRGAGADWGARVTPVVVDAAQPTPAIGWMNRERGAFFDRLGTVDLSIWLAVLHHLVLTGGIPLQEVLGLVAATSRHAIIEHIGPGDPSVRTMTAGRRWARVPDAEEFERRLHAQGFVVWELHETSPTRTLVLARCPT